MRVLHFILAMLGCMLFALAGPVLLIKGTRILIEKYEYLKQHRFISSLNGQMR
tara:strand:- start:207 stop:365 length:159 start_codon:yes stop_codon:yes gene_type:complete